MQQPKGTVQFSVPAQSLAIVLPKLVHARNEAR